MALAKLTDVETSLVRRLTPSEAEHAEALLLRAESLISAEVPDFAERTDPASEGYDSTFLQKVVHITSDAAARVFRNPEAFVQETEGNYSYTINREAASGLLNILDSEWVRLGVVSEDFGTLSVGYDGYARKRMSYARPDLVFQYGWPGDKPGMSERII